MRLMILTALAVTGGLLAGCASEETKQLRALSERCAYRDMTACRPLVVLQTACGHGDMVACGKLGSISTISDPAEAHYWEWRAKGGNE